MEMRNIIITGAGKGIGYETVKSLLNDNENTRILAISRNTDQLLPLQNIYENRLLILSCNLTEMDHFKQIFMEKMINQIHPIDVLINNAGILYSASFESLKYQQIHEMMDVNFLVPAEMIRFLLPYFNETRRSHCVNIGSMGGVQGSTKFAGMNIYSATKAALAVLTECLAEEYKNRNISFNCLALGAVQTEMLQAAFPNYKAPVDAQTMGKFVADFSLNKSFLFNGKILPVAFSIP